MKKRNKPKREYKKCKSPGCNFVTRRSRVMRVHKKNCPRPRPTLRCGGHAHYSEIARAICTHKEEPKDPNKYVKILMQISGEMAREM